MSFWTSIDGVSSSLALSPRSVIAGISDGQEYHFPNSVGNFAVFKKLQSPPRWKAVNLYQDRSSQCVFKIDPSMCIFRMPVLYRIADIEPSM